MQLDLFSVYDAEQPKETKSSIYEKLKHYGIDDYYRKNMKGKQMVLSEINEKLRSLPNYKAYHDNLINELKLIVPVTNVQLGNDYNHLYQLDNGVYRYYCRYISRKGVLGCTSPVYCLEMIDDDFFKN